MVGFATGRRGDGIMVSCGSRGQRHPGIEGMKQISIERVGHEEPVMAPNTEVLVRRLDVPSLRDIASDPSPSYPCPPSFPWQYPSHHTTNIPLHTN